ncbi:MAG: hypothetical protein DRP24_01680 [Thermotoga sp.]|nr:MAG: hypothetical protein DRP24_01680 [Thermotoga sp.]
MKSLILVLIILASLAFAEMNVSFELVSSNLNLHLSGCRRYMISFDDFSTVTSLKNVTIPWKKGLSATVTILGYTDDSTEMKQIFVDGNKDLPPKLLVTFPQYLDLEEPSFIISSKDDWDVPRIDVLVDSKESKELDPFFLEDGKHVLEIVAVDSSGNVTREKKTFIVDTSPPDEPSVSYKDAEYLLSDSASYALYINKNKFEKVDVMEKREPGMLLFREDEAGNRSFPVVVKPPFVHLNPVTSKTPITSVPFNMILLSTYSPYNIMTKVFIPEEKKVILEKGTVLNILGSGELVVSGIFSDLEGSIVIKGQGKLLLQNGANFYLENSTITCFFDTTSARLLYLSNVSLYQEVLNLQNVDVVVIENMRVQEIHLKNVKRLYLRNVESENLTVENVLVGDVRDATFTAMNVESFSDITFRNLRTKEIKITGLSKSMILNSFIEKLNISKASSVRIRGCKVLKVSLEYFSMLESAFSKLVEISLKNSGMVLKETSISDMSKDEFSFVERR